MTDGTRCSCRRLLLGCAGSYSPIRRRSVDAGRLHGRHDSHATYRNHGPDTPKQSRSSLILRASAIGRSSSSSSRFTTQARAIARATTSGPAIDRRSSTPATSRSGLPKTRSLTSMLQACGQERLLLKSFQQATSGRPNPSIRITSNDIPAATPAISSGQTGGCRFARRRLQRRHDSRSSSKTHVRVWRRNAQRRCVARYALERCSSRVIPAFHNVNLL